MQEGVTPFPLEESMDIPGVIFNVGAPKTFHFSELQAIMERILAMRMPPFWSHINFALFCIKHLFSSNKVSRNKIIIQHTVDFFILL